MTIHDKLSALYRSKINPVLSNLTTLLSRKDEPGPNALKIADTNIPPDEVSFEAKLDEHLKIKTKMPSKVAPIKQWRYKSHEEDLKSRYLNPEYIFKLLNLTHIEEYDSGARPVCPCNCSFNCQAKFRYDAKLLAAEMETWWGDKSNNIIRDSLLCNDIKDWAIKQEDGTYKLRWFIANRQVCRNFYLRARGQHHSHVQKLEKQILHEKRTVVSVNLDRYDMKDSRKSPKKDGIVAWLSMFKKQVGAELMPGEDVVVLPY